MFDSAGGGGRGGVPSISPQPPTQRLPSLEIHEYIRKSLLMRLLTRLVLKKTKNKEETKNTSTKFGPVFHGNQNEMRSFPVRE